jgi:hypothetical protein
VKIRGVTRKNVREAALIGQIIAEAALAETNVTCVVDDDDCCGHMLEEHCVAEAIEASKMAAWLWVATSNAIATPRHERAKAIAEVKTPAEKQRLKRLYAWVDTVSGHIARLGLAELHAAALLCDGVLPPDWKIVPGRATRPGRRYRRPRWP